MSSNTLQQKDLQHFIAFLHRYDTFLHKMARDEEEKMQALVSGDLTRIEHALSTAQANAKQIENFELKREDLQRQAGVGQATFSEILELLGEDLREEGAALFASFERKINDIRFRNTKAMDFARAHLQTVNPDALKETAGSGGNAGSAASNAYARASKKEEQTSLLETKI